MLRNRTIYMASYKSYSIYIELFQLMYLDTADCYTIPKQDVMRDLEEIQNRCNTEGIGFLTKTLPLFGRSLDRALTNSCAFDATGLSLRNDGIPHFCGFLFERVLESIPVADSVIMTGFTDGVVQFDGGTIIGATHLVLKKDPDVEAIRRIRQLMYYLYKLELDYDQSTKSAVFAAFVSTDAEVATVNLDDSRCVKVLEKAQQLCCSVFGTFNHREINPGHGPGAVAHGETAEEKLSFSRIFRDLEAEYPFTEYFVSGLNHVVDEPDYIQGLETHDLARAKVTLVPKDSRGPRLISMEPLEIQWIQQGLMRAMVRHLELHPKTCGRVNFSDQTVNRKLALESSKSGEWATLDMKEASDRVGLALVKSIFKHCPMLAGLTAARSAETKLPDGTVIHLNKFAPMGSATCFPVESFVFYVLCVSVLITELGWKQRKALSSVYVYGDDLIVRTEAVPVLLQCMPLFGLMFNEAKCCYTGSFRESCGCDAFAGVDVTPIRLRKTIHRFEDQDWRRRNPKLFFSHLGAVIIASTVVHSNNLHERGYYRSAEYLKMWVEARVGPIPFSKVSTMDGSLLGCLSWVRPEVGQPLFHVIRRFNVRYQRIEVYSPRVVVPKKAAATNSWRSVLVGLTKRPTTETPTDTYAIPTRIKLKFGWNSLI